MIWATPIRGAVIYTLKNNRLLITGLLKTPHTPQKLMICCKPDIPTVSTYPLIDDESLKTRKDFEKKSPVLIKFQWKLYFYRNLSLTNCLSFRIWFTFVVIESTFMGNLIFGKFALPPHRGKRYVVRVGKTPKHDLIYKIVAPSCSLRSCDLV